MAGIIKISAEARYWLVYATMKENGFSEFYVENIRRLIGCFMYVFCTWHLERGVIAILCDAKAETEIFRCYTAEKFSKYCAHLSTPNKNYVFITQ